MSYKIITYPNPILRKKAATIQEFDDELQEIIAKMATTMFEAPGAGLAAPQVGISRRLVIINTTEHPEDAPEDFEPDNTFLALINPEIYEAEGSQIGTEGCLSVLEYSAKVKRFSHIKVRAQDPTGEPLDFPADDFFARVIQHELDHLDGKLFIDRISALKRNLYKKKLKKILAQKEAKK